MKRSFTVEALRNDFPVLSREINGKPLVYLDNAASTQKPQAVIDAVTNFYSQDYANVHRGVHKLSQIATDHFEAAREKIQRFIGAQHNEEIIFVSGATAAINLVAASFGSKFVTQNDEIIISAMEHHANIVPWQMLCEKVGAKLRVIPINQNGDIELDAIPALLNSRTKLLAVSHISNALGTINPVKEIIAMAHAKDVPVLIDGAQALAHTKVDVTELDCDFYVFSGHKFFAPTGTGVLYGKKRWLDAMPPYQTGGNMIKMVSFEKTLFQDLPHKFEPGTPNIADFIGLGAAIDYFTQWNTTEIFAYEHGLLEYALAKLCEVPGLHLMGAPVQQASVISFVMDQAHPHDIGTILDNDAIAIRSGHHCAMPLMKFFKVPATARASLACYNTYADVDKLVASLYKVIEVFA